MTDSFTDHSSKLGGDGTVQLWFEPRDWEDTALIVDMPLYLVKLRLKCTCVL